MIRIYINNDANGSCNGFRVKGHAGYADAGQDIVCAAVSVLVINTINSIERFTSDVFEVQQDEESGLIEMNMISTISSDAKLLLDSFILGLLGIEENYGNDYIKIC